LGSYSLRRLLIAIPVLLGITVVTFTFANLAPGDPVSAMIDPNRPLPPAEIAKLKEELGLDQPIPVRYAIWLEQVLRGNLGYSLVNHRSVAGEILDRLPQTILLMATAWLVSVLIGVPLGIYSAFHQYSRADYVLTLFVFAGISVPSFLLALLAIYLFAFRVPIFPTSGMYEPLSQLNPIVDRLWHLVLPATVLGIEGAASYLRYTRSSVLEVMRQDYVTTARAKGLAEWRLRVRHVFRNALLPLVTIAGLHLPALIGGALFIEMLFSWPGMARLAITATLGRDYPMIMGVGLVAATMVLLANLVADLTYALADPRIRYG
jgi:peptide/nickel transport system permease protein